MKNNTHCGGKGFFFTFDSVIALSFLLIAATVLFQLYSHDSYDTIHYKDMYFNAEDAMQILSLTKLSDLNDTFVDKLINDTYLEDEDKNKTLIDICGLLWSVNQTDYIENITEETFSPLLQTGTKYAINIKDINKSNTIYASNTGYYNAKTITSASRIISGYKENVPFKGYTARSTIKEISKETSKYLYFGGFIGQGNITKTFTMPSNIDTIKKIYLEMDAGDNFTIYINNNYSGNYSRNASQTSLRANLKYNITNPTYLSYIQPNENNISIVFLSDELSQKYIGGGFIKISYNTTQLNTAESQKKYYFPGIDGMFNIYSSFFVPGQLNNMTVFLHYDTNNTNGTVYLKIANATIFTNKSVGEQTIYVSEGQISANLSSSGLNYNSLSSRTIPIRMGIKNLTGLSDGSDVVLITDLSGSMSTSDVQPGNQERMAVAKIADKEFVNTILNNEGQKVGLIAYGTQTDHGRTIYLTQNNATLQTKITGYDHVLGATCISCGIADSTAMLLTTINVTTIMNNGSTWYYNDSFLTTEPPDDSHGNRWYDYNYTLQTNWSTGNAVFGNGTGSIPVTTEIATGGSNGNTTYANLWDDNQSTIPVSFETGYNSTANTFGWNMGDDGWDYDPQNNVGPYGYDDNIDYNLVANEMLEFDTRTGAPARNICTNNDCSGAYGIQINITPDMHAILSANGTARLSFKYEWDGNARFEDSDEVWIKAQWTSPTTGVHWLGTEQSSAGGDTSPEINYRINPDIDIPPTSTTQDITPWIEGQGVYYLDIGGKLQANRVDEWGYFRFDDILVEIRNGTDNYYFRKNFTIDDMNKVGRGFLKVTSDDMTDIYLNGQLIDSDPGPNHDAEYWNRIELIDRSYFKEGTNILATVLYNSIGSTRFDMKLDSFDDSRNKAMLVMSDGGANYCYPPIWNCPDTQAKQQAIDFACYAYENYGIISHAVGFGSTVDELTLRGIADCGHGIYRSSNDADELKQIYQDIANTMISYNTQKLNITGTYTHVIIYPDSYIYFNYTPTTEEIKYKEVTVTIDREEFRGSIEDPKNKTYSIPSGITVLDARVTSYSSDYWTDSIYINNSDGSGWQKAYNLSDYGLQYPLLGDPYIVHIPSNLVIPGNNFSIRMNTGFNPINSTGASPDNRMIYTFKVPGSVGYGEVFSNQTTATEDAKERLRIFLEQYGITLGDVETYEYYIGKTPWMFGPAVFSVHVWE